MNDSSLYLTQTCPFCGQEIPAEAAKCTYCGKWLNQLPDASSWREVGRCSNAQPLSHLALLFLLTFGTYSIYWFYRNWKDLKAYKDPDITPWWRAFGLFVPIYNIFLIYGQLRDIRDAAQAVGSRADFSPGWVTAGMFLFHAVFVEVSDYAFQLTQPVLGLDLLQIAIELVALSLFLVVQNTLNSLWAKVQPDLDLRPGFAPGEWGALVVGGLLWIMSLAGSVMP